MPEDKLPYGRGMSGSKQGQIKTPMPDGNVDNQGGGEKIHSYKSAMNLDSPGPSKGSLKTDSSIKGPGSKGAYPNKY